jgi:translation elongation factor EF-1beta
MTTDTPNIYVGECTLISNDYTGKALTISMKGSALSTTHISMTLKPDQQKVLREYLLKDIIEKLEEEAKVEYIPEQEEIASGILIALSIVRGEEKETEKKIKIPNCPWCLKDYGEAKPLEWDQFKEVWVCRSHGSFDESQLKDGV